MTAAPEAEERERLARLLFPDSDPLPSPADLERRYPPRTLAAGAKVTRFAPSPTGFVHIGALYAALLNKQTAGRSSGVYVLRIEDTDSKREVEGATEGIVRTLERFGLGADEGPSGGADSGPGGRGAYGPYLQSMRLDVHRACVRELVRTGRAYPCFCTEEELRESSEIQRLQKARPGYYGTFARWRDRPLADVEAALGDGRPFVVRFRSDGDHAARLVWDDGVHGRVTTAENDLDAVILKSDGSSLYHLAHLVDDHFMRVTHVIRGDEWMSSVPLHLQLYRAFGWTPPRFAHFAPLQKSEPGAAGGESRRKLSKRHDPEANVDYYDAAGIPDDAVLEYLLNIADPSFEEWRKKEPEASLRSFPVSEAGLSASGALVDLVKLASVSKDVISRLSPDDVFTAGLAWAERHDEELAGLMRSDPDYSRAALAIERGGPKPSKRIGTWRDLRGQLEWFFDGPFGDALARGAFPFPEKVSAEDRVAVVRAFLDTYDPSDGRDAWFDKCKAVASSLGFAPSVKEWKAEPGRWKGHVGDVTGVLRVGVSGLAQTPDLCDTMRVMGRDRVARRLEASARPPT